MLSTTVVEVKVAL